jgi:hypothetical protein
MNRGGGGNFGMTRGLFATMLERADTKEAIGLNRSRLRSTRPVSMKILHAPLVVITTCTFALLLYGCASSPDASSGAKSPPSSSSPASPEDHMRQALRRYKVGVTTHKKFMDDATAGSWKVHFGGMGMEVVSGDTTVSMTAGFGDREVCSLVFLGKASPASGKAPDVERFVLKQITFKP